MTVRAKTYGMYCVTTAVKHLYFLQRAAVDNTQVHVQLCLLLQTSPWRTSPNMTLVHTSHLVGVSNVLTISSCTLSRTVEDCEIDHTKLGSDQWKCKL